MAYIQGESRSQTSLFPVSLEELIPEDHLVRVIDLYVAKLDLGQLGFDKVSRHAQEEAFERMAQQMQLHPEMMERRRSIVEHPCGNLKQWLFGNERFLLRQLEGARAEMALAVTAYNLKRAISVLGAKQLMQLMG